MDKEEWLGRKREEGQEWLQRLEWEKMWVQQQSERQFLYSTRAPPGPTQSSSDQQRGGSSRLEACIGPAPPAVVRPVSTALRPPPDSNPRAVGVSDPERGNCSRHRPDSAREHLSQGCLSLTVPDPGHGAMQQEATGVVAEAVRVGVEEGAEGPGMPRRSTTRQLQERSCEDLEGKVQRGAEGAAGSSEEASKMGMAMEMMKETVVNRLKTAHFGDPETGATEICNKLSFQELAVTLEDEERWQRILKGMYQDPAPGKIMERVQHQGEGLKLATLNINGLGGRLEEVARALAKAGVDVCVMQETRCAQLTNCCREGYTYYSSTTTAGRNGVGMAIRDGVKGQLDGGKLVFVSDRIMVARLAVGTIIGLYAPASGVANSEADLEAYDVLVRATVDKNRRKEMLVMGDMNATMRIEGGEIMGKSERGERFEALTKDFDLHLQNWKWRGPREEWTWDGTNIGQGKMTLDWVAATSEMEKQIQQVQAEWPAVETDHRMVIVQLRKAEGKQQRPKWNIKNQPERHQESLVPNRRPVEEAWNAVRKLTAKEAGSKKPGSFPKKACITEPTWQLMQRKHEALGKWREAKGQQGEEERRKEFCVVRNATNAAVKRDRETEMERVATSVESMSAEGNTGGLHKILRSFYRRGTSRRGYDVSVEDLAGAKEHCKHLLTEVPVIPVEPLPLVSREKFIPRPPRVSPSTCIRVYTDGSFTTDPKAAGYGVYFPKFPQRTVAGRCGPGDMQSCMRGEVHALLVALERCDLSEAVEVVTDSMAVVHGFTKALGSWQAGDFAHIPQGDLWREIAGLASAREVTIRWTRSHQAIVDEDTQGNNTADTLADQGRRMPLPPQRKHKEALPHWQIDDSTPSEREILTALTAINQAGAPGVDGIGARMPAASPETKVALVNVISQAWNSAAVPQDWTVARMVLLPKVPGASQWTQYRGITLLSVASKVMTRVILSRTSTVPLAEWQFGFRRARDTTMATAIVKHLLDEARRTNTPLHLVFIDITKAYDSVDRATLWRTMELYGFGERLVSLLKALYQDEVQLNVEGAYAGSFQSERGVRQGCILSPTLFNVMLDRAVESTWQMMQGVSMRDTVGGGQLEIKVVGYADDLVIVANSKRQLQANLHVLARALASIGCAISVEKTKYLAVRKKARTAENTPEVHAAHCERVKEKLGKVAEKAKEAVIATEGQRKVIRWEGECMKCPACVFLASEANSLQTHLLHKHKMQLPVLALGSKQDRFIQDKFAEDLDGARCRWCNVTLYRPASARRHILGNGCKPRREALAKAAAEGRPPPIPQFAAAPAGAAGAAPKPCAHPCCGVKQCKHKCCRVIGGQTTHVDTGQNSSDEEPEPDQEEEGEIKLYGKPVEEVTVFKYLGRLLSVDGEEESEIKKKVQTARGVLIALMRPLYQRSACSARTKLAVYLTVTRAQLMFGSETWTLTEGEWMRLQVFEMQALRRIIGWKAKMTQKGLRYPKNADVWGEVRKLRPGTQTVREAVETRQLEWWGKILRMGEETLVRRALLAVVPRPAYVGWHRTRALVPRLRKLLMRAGLREDEAWERDVWRAGVAAMVEAGQAAVEPEPPSTAAAAPP